MYNISHENNVTNVNKMLFQGAVAMMMMEMLPSRLKNIEDVVNWISLYV